MYDLDYFTQRLITIGYGADTAVYKAVSDVLVVLGDTELTKEDMETAMNLISEYGREDIGTIPLYGFDAWEPFNYGNVKLGEYVRVKENMYDSPTGAPHNGRVGVLLDVNSRRCTVRYLGMQQVSEMRHPIDNLLSIKRGVQLKTKRE